MSAAHSDQDIATKECRFCRQTIHPEAEICSACQEPQGGFRGVVRIVSSFLPSLVALGSLGIAYLQYAAMVDARAEEQLARDAEEAAVEASEDALTTLVDNLSLTQRDVNQLHERLPVLKEDLGEVRRKAKDNPADPAARRDLLLRKVPLKIRPE